MLDAEPDFDLAASTTRDTTQLVRSDGRRASLIISCLIPVRFHLQLTDVQQRGFIATAIHSLQAHQAAQASPDLGHAPTPDPTACSACLEVLEKSRGGDEDKQHRSMDSMRHGRVCNSLAADECPRIPGITGPPDSS